MDARFLHGYSAEIALSYGMPHINAFYTGKGDDVNKYSFSHDAKCFICGRPAEHVHHWPPKGYARHFTMVTPNGTYHLMPALFAICPRCHSLFHGDVGRERAIKAVWRWDKVDYGYQWANGELIRKGYPPHSLRLYNIGKWEIRGCDDDVPICYYRR